jgi:hypothetical protein
MCGAAAAAGDAPSCSLPASQLVGAPLTDVMVAAGMLKSKGEVRRLIKGGGVYMNNAKVRLGFRVCCVCIIDCRGDRCGGSSREEACT